MIAEMSMRQQSLNWLTSQDYILLNWKNLGQKLEEWKERLLTAFPDLNAISQGRDVLLVFNHRIGDVIKRVTTDNCDSEAVYLARPAKIVQRDILQLKYCFQGTFPSKCQSDAIPATLLTPLNMIFRGTTMANQQSVDRLPSQVCLSISQLLGFNTLARNQDVISIE